VPRMECSQKELAVEGGIGHDAVRARVWSEAHFCPAADRGSALARNENQGLAFVEDNETGIVAHFRSSPYSFVLQNGKFGVRCDYEKRHNR
jgi:hypothetical protein